ncbi:DNA repair protein RadC [Serratia odorifera]|uniref:DNA repair protein RadC n=1 Tax=Serratia odorifera TaxID=618 RepID=A0A447KPC8_SEROD|nr:DNA repair protein RadC [Serratia odorifera]
MSCEDMSLWPGELAPREKLLRDGAAALSDVELLAIFLRTGLPGVHVMQRAEQMLLQFGSLHQLIAADYAQFCSQKGVGDATYSQLQAISELAFRCFACQLAQENALLNPKVTRHYLQSLLAHPRARSISGVVFGPTSTGSFAIKRCLLVPSAASSSTRGKSCAKR